MNFLFRMLVWPLAIFSLANTAWAQKATLAEYEEKYLIHSEEKLKIESREALLIFRFSKSEPFVFIMPRSLFSKTPEPGKQETWWAQDLIVHGFDHDKQPKTPDIPILVPSKVVQIRHTLVAAHGYFVAAFKKAGLDATELNPKSPIKVYIAKFVDSPIFELAVANVWDSTIKVRYNLARNLIDGYLVHEYFHIVQKLAAADLISQSQFPEDREHPWRHLQEWGSQWASDEPILIRDPFRSQGPIMLDSQNQYVENGERDVEKGERGEQEYILLCDEPIPGQNPYHSALLMKYFAEQVKGGRDESAAIEILKLHRTLDRPVKFPAILREMGKALDPLRFTGKTSEERWESFFRAFAASIVVQRGQEGNAPARLLGFHDDAFASLKEMYPMDNPERALHDDYSRPVKQYYPEAAYTDAERQVRLRTISREREIRPLSFSTELVMPSREFIHHRDRGKKRASRRLHHAARPRGGYFYAAAGGSGVQVFLLHQASLSKTPGAYWDRESSLFVLDSKFELNSKKWGVVAHHPNIVQSETRSDYLWVGLINSRLDNKPGRIVWGYALTPGLLEQTREDFPARFDKLFKTPTVVLVDGDLYRRNPLAAEFVAGDKFTFSVVTTGVAHVGPKNRRDIPRDQRSIDVRLFYDSGPEAGNPIPTRGGNLRYDSAYDKKSDVCRYTVSGQFPPTLPSSGEGLVEWTTTSLLNLGHRDRSEDRSFRFVIRDLIPKVKGLGVFTLPDDRYVYEGFTSVNDAILVKDPSVPQKLRVRVIFNMPMKPIGLRISAGFKAPFDKYTMKSVDWQSDGAQVTGEFEIDPKSTTGGRILTFSISGMAESGKMIDSDPGTRGNQPDTRHGVLFNMVDYYDFTFSFRAQGSGREGPSEFSATFGPAIVKCQLLPDPEDLVNGIGSQSRKLLAKIRSFIKDVKRQATYLKDIRLKDVQAPFTEKDSKAELALWEEAQETAKALVRATAGFQTYQYDPFRSRAIDVQFGGAELSARSEGKARRANPKLTKEYDYVTHEVKGRIPSFHLKEVGKKTHPRLIYELLQIRLAVLRFDPDDYRRLSAHCKAARGYKGNFSPGQDLWNRLDGLVAYFRDAAWRIGMGASGNDRTVFPRIAQDLWSWKPELRVAKYRTFPKFQKPGFWRLVLAPHLLKELPLKPEVTVRTTTQDLQKPESKPVTSEKTHSAFRFDVATGGGRESIFPWNRRGILVDDSPLGRQVRKSSFVSQATGPSALEVVMARGGVLVPQVIAHSNRNRWSAEIKERIEQGTHSVTQCVYQFSVDRVGGSPEKDKPEAKEPEEKIPSLGRIQGQWSKHPSAQEWPKGKVAVLLRRIRLKDNSKSSTSVGARPQPLKKILSLFQNSRKIKRDIANKAVIDRQLDGHAFYYAADATYREFTFKDLPQGDYVCSLVFEDPRFFSHGKDVRITGSKPVSVTIAVRLLE